MAWNDGRHARGAQTVALYHMSNELLIAARGAQGSSGVQKKKQLATTQTVKKR